MTRRRVPCNHCRLICLSRSRRHALLGKEANAVEFKRAVLLCQRLGAARRRLCVKRAEAGIECSVRYDVSSIFCTKNPKHKARGVFTFQSNKKMLFAGGSCVIFCLTTRTLGWDEEIHSALSFLFPSFPLNQLMLKTAHLRVAYGKCSFAPGVHFVL